MTLTGRSIRVVLIAAGVAVAGLGTGISARAAAATPLGVGVTAPTDPTFGGPVREGSPSDLTVPVATFSDPTPGPLANYSATVSWGDGATSPGILSDAGGSFAVSATHTYADGGLVTFSVTVTDSDGDTGTGSATFSPAEADNGVVSGRALNIPVGQSWTGTVASFTDVYVAQWPGDFVATINWGDASPISDAVMGGGMGDIQIQGTHTYAAEGSYTIAVSLSEDDGSIANVPITSSARVAIAFNMTTLPIALGEGATFTGQLATFTDNLGNDPIGNYAATVNWGDGSSSPGAVSSLGADFSVSGSHSYTDEGSFPVGITVVDSDGTAVTDGTMATISEADVLAGAGNALTLTAGSQFSGSVASFSDSYAATTAASMGATIRWGDGSSGPGIVSGGAGSFTVAGSHTYTAAGTYTTNVTLLEAAPGTATASVAGIANVAAAAGSGGHDVFKADTVVRFAPLGQPFSGIIGRFDDPNSQQTPGGLVATIDWGDQSAVAVGSVSQGRGHDFLVSGTHTYALRGVYVVHVHISTIDGSASATSRNLILVQPRDGEGGDDGNAHSGDQGDNTPKPSATPEPSDKPKPSDEPTAAPKPSSEPTATPTPTPTATAAPSPQPTSTPAASPTPTATPSPTPTCDPKHEPGDGGDNHGDHCR